MRTLLSGAIILTCDSAHAMLSPGDVVMQDDRVSYVGPVYSGEYDVRLPMSQRLIMPGLVNAHTHTPMTLFRGLSDEVDLQVFLAERVWPREWRLTGEEAYAGALLAAVEMLRSGVTAYADMYFFQDDLLRAAIDAGARALITPGILQVPEWQERLGDWEQQTLEALAFCRRWNGHEGRIHTGLGPHAPYTLSIEAMGEIAAEARRAGLPVHTHLLEAEWEREIYGGAPVTALENRDFFDGHVLAAHSVWVDADDLAIYDARDVAVAHCPQSNAKLGAGIAPLAAMLEAGLTVGIGTDGAATNNNLDLWEELRWAPLLAKAIGRDPTVVTAQQALQMATAGGAAAIGRDDVGHISVGAKADLIALRLDDTTMTPVFDGESWAGHTVYSAGRDLVDSVWVNGQCVVRDGEVLSVDVERVRHDAQQAATAVSRRLEEMPA